ncbi:MAG: OB-fold nucleic acid binding domain-containing protein [Candidatus Altiarchaeota archaeon]
MISKLFSENIGGYINMNIKELQPNSQVESIELEVTEVGETREFTNFRGTGKVANAKGKDVSGEISITLWNEDIDKIKVGDKVKIENGWVKEYRGDLQVSSGKFGKITVL